jgi:hypothetical protein
MNQIYMIDNLLISFNNSKFLYVYNIKLENKQIFNKFFILIIGLITIFIIKHLFYYDIVH